MPRRIKRRLALSTSVGAVYPFFIAQGTALYFELIRKAFSPRCAGETEEQFQNSVKVVRELGFDTVNTAAYSQRPNTPAADWECQVADLIKADRLQRINRCVRLPEFTPRIGNTSRVVS